MNGPAFLPSQYLLSNHPAGGGSYAPIVRNGHLQAEKGVHSGRGEPEVRGYYPQNSQDIWVKHDDEDAYPPPYSSCRQQHPSDPRAEKFDAAPQHWNGQYPLFQYSHPGHGGYPYPPPARNDGQPPQPSPDGNYTLPRFSDLVCQYPTPYYHASPQPIPRQRAAVACKYCRKRKIRCSGFEDSLDGRCQNCARLDKQCLFHPISSRGAFVPISALYGPGSHSTAGRDLQRHLRPQPRESTLGGEPKILYGAQGQQLGPVSPGDGSSSMCPLTPLNYASQSYLNSAGPPQRQGIRTLCQDRGQVSPCSEQDVRRKRSSQDNDQLGETAQYSRPPYVKRQRPTHGSGQDNGGSRYAYSYPTDITLPSAATSTTNKQSDPPAHFYDNENQTEAPFLHNRAAGSVQPLCNLPTRHNSRTPSPGERSSAVPGRSGMSVQDMLHQLTPKGAGSEPRGREGNDKLEELYGMKR